jgi:hypothetical protein
MRVPRHTLSCQLWAIIALAIAFALYSVGRPRPTDYRGG